MHLDHFRPQVHFSDLANDPQNLVLACPGCNRLKADHWPAHGTGESYVGDEGFIEPFLMNRLEFFDISEDGGIRGVKPPAKYEIGLLQLDRQSRKKIRALRRTKLRLLEKLLAHAEKIEARTRMEPALTEKGKQEFLQIAKQLREEAKAYSEMLFDLGSK
jgi:hypothetical protein